MYVAALRNILRNLTQVILEEGGGEYATGADYGAANDFSFPGVQEQEMQDGYAEMEQLHDGPMAPSSQHEHGNPGLGGAPTSPRSGGGHTNPLSTGTGPSQSLTGLLAGANDLLGEIGTTQQTTVLTGTLPGQAGSRTASFRQPKPPDN